MMKSSDIPKFSSEAEEAAWWYENRQKHEDNFVQALAEGRAKHVSIAERLEMIRNVKTVTLDDNDAAVAARLASEKGIEVQSFIKSLIHEALQKELTNAA
jgi:predicted DNA binding CopG/RHH family protein